MEEKIKSLFISYLEKDISKSDEEILLHWINKNPGYLNELKEIRRLWNLANATAKFKNSRVENEWRVFVKRIEKGKITQHKPQKNILYWLPRMAAIFLLGAAISAAITYTLINDGSDNLVYQEINTPAGAQSKITLPDGSSVWLNAKSCLRYSNQFGKKQREIFLTGEAFFEVSKNKEKLFVVQADDLSIKAYGTSFNVKSYPDENTVEATLIEGSIGVENFGFKKGKTNEIMLEPNQRVVYYKASNKVNEPEPEKTEENAVTVNTERKNKQPTYMISKGIDPFPFTAWKEGTLVISSETLANLAIKLERKYDVKIRFENDAIKKIKFSGSLQNETIEQAIEAIGIAAHIDFEIKDRDILFKGIEKTK